MRISKEMIYLKNERIYSNPVVTGFHPDPSIIRVGEDYYMANSTFQYFPAIVILHSKDLINWEIIGHAVTNSEDLDLSDINDSHGIWAPDLSYHNGIFYIFATLRLNGGVEEASKRIIRRQLIVKSERPEGPYSKPIFLDIDGIDPSHFIDDDGSHYMVLNPKVRLIKLSDNCTEAVSEPITIWEGTGKNSPEGPHLLKKDGYYYAILAEGGTEYNHCITLGRSKNLLGPYENCPYNPVLQQKDPMAKLQRAGHGKLVQTQKGDWWMAYLCGRPNGGRFCTLGRETALDPVQWTEDGWFIVNNLQGPSETQQVPDLPEVKYVESYYDDFDSDKISLQWHFVRNPKKKDYSLTERSGYYRIWTGDHDLNSIHAENTLLRREKHHNYSASIKLEFYPKNNGEEAGLTTYYSTNTYIKLGLLYHNGLMLRLVENRANIINTISEISDIKEEIIYLKVKVEGQRREFFYSYDNKNWKSAGTIENATFLSDEGSSEKKRFTGTMVGLYANNGGSGTRVNADFDWLNYSF
jgi:xylan 1,4-beta-xylosidase